MPAKLWHGMMENYFPNSRRLQLSKEVFDKLYKYKSRQLFRAMDNRLEYLPDEAFRTRQPLNQRL